MKRAIVEYQLVDHGVDVSQYFEGCGTAFTRFDEVATGIGDSYREALNDAAEQLAQMDIDVSPELEAEIAETDDRDAVYAVRTTYRDPGDADSDFDDELHYFASIRVKLATVSAMTRREKRGAAIEREQVEWVFGLTGGELADKPWHATAITTSYCSAIHADSTTAHPFKRSYWYDGVPSYAVRDFPSICGESDSDYRTVIEFSCGNFGIDPSPAIHYRGHVWTKVAIYTNSGETECPMRNDPETRMRKREDIGGWINSSTLRMDATAERCPLCDAAIGEEHGYIYIGDCAEVVYKRGRTIRAEARKAISTSPEALGSTNDGKVTL